MRRRASAKPAPGRALMPGLFTCHPSSARYYKPDLRSSAVPMKRGHFFPRDEYYMRLALREAERALEHDDVPIGAVLVRDGEVIAAACNERELRSDPSAHAEVLALREAGRKLGCWRITDAVLYVTIEPSAMCAGALVWAR